MQGYGIELPHPGVAESGVAEPSRYAVEGRLLAVLLAGSGEPVRSRRDLAREFSDALLAFAETLESLIDGDVLCAYGPLVFPSRAMLRAFQQIEEVPATPTD
jgi:hypothetical protein